MKNVSMENTEGTAFARNTMESAGNSGERAMSVCVGVVSSTQLPTRASPSTASVTRELPVTAPEPVRGAKFTVTPPAGLPYWSRARTVGRRVTPSPGTPSCCWLDATSSVTAASATGVAVKASGCTIGSMDAPNTCGSLVRVPMRHPSTPTLPSASVRRSVLPRIAPPPLMSAKRTSAPGMRLSNWSKSVSAGGSATAVPTTAGCVDGARRTITNGGPGVTEVTNVTGASPSAVAVSDCGPARVPSRQPPDVATPLALVRTVSLVTTPPPLATCQRTSTPARPRPRWSLSVTAGAGLIDVFAGPASDVAPAATSSVAMRGSGPSHAVATTAVDTPTSSSARARGTDAKERAVMTRMGVQCRVDEEMRRAGFLRP